MMEMNYHASIPSLASTLTDSGSIDWTLIQQVDPIYLRSSSGIDSMKLIAQQFLKATTVPLENPALILKLLQVLQVIIGYLCTSQDNFAELLKQKDTENQKLKEIIENEPRNVIIGTQCPVCDKVFKSVFFLDKHIYKSHPNVSALWQSIRMPYLINQTPIYPNVYAPDQIKISNSEPDELHKAFEEMKKEFKRIHHSGEKHLQKKIENRILNVENKIVKLETTISEPLLHYQAQMQTQAQQQPFIIQPQPIPQVVLQTIPVQKQVEFDKSIPTNDNSKTENNSNQKSTSSHHHSHKRKSSHKSIPQQSLVEQATSPFVKSHPQNNFMESDESYNTNSDSFAENEKNPAPQNNIENKKENQMQNISNPTKQKSNIQKNNEKANAIENKTKKKIKKKIKLIIKSDSLKTSTNQNSNPNQHQKQNQDIEKPFQTQNTDHKSSKKTKEKGQNQNIKPSIKQVSQSPAETTQNVDKSQNIGIVLNPPPASNVKKASADTNERKKEKVGNDIVIGIVKRNDFNNSINSIDNVPKPSNTNSVFNKDNIPDTCSESELEVTIPVKKNQVISPQDAVYTNQNDIEENEIPRPYIQELSTKCVKSLPNQAQNCKLSPSSMVSLPSISSEFGTPQQKRNRSLLQDMSSESDVKLPFRFEQK